MTPDTARRAGTGRARAWWGLVLAGACMWLASALISANETPAPRAGGMAFVMSIDGVIGPASADYFLRGLAEAKTQGADVVVLRMDTPGGLDTSMREIIRGILSASVPVLSYVGPSGARAASAGTYILYASHVAAMAPGTNLGAATPVAIGGGGGLPMPGREPASDDKGDKDDKVDKGADDSKDAKRDKDAGGEADPKKDREDARSRPAGSAMEAKTINDAVAYIRSLADLHGRNADWAEEAVRDAASLSATQALERNVIDLVATSVPALLKQAHGREVRLGESTVTLNTEGLTLQAHDPDLRSRILGVITNPNLALILMMIGIYGLIFEFMNPGALYPGTIGAICLLMGLYALSALPLNYAGLGLIVLGIALMVAEAFTPSVGILGIGGVIAFVLGSTLLIDTEAPGFALSLPVIAGMAAASLGFTLLVVRMALKSRRSRVVSGTQAMVGQTARVLDWSGDHGHVFVVGERWSAVGTRGLTPGQAVRVRAVDGLCVEVVGDTAP